MAVFLLQDLSYGNVRYTSLTDQVKRPRDPVRQVYDKLKGESTESSYVSYSKQAGGDSGGKDSGAWATGVRHFEKSPPKPSSFEHLHSELRKSKGLSALAPKDSGSSSGGTWGEMRFFQEKPKTTSPLDMLRDRMQKVRKQTGRFKTRVGTSLFGFSSELLVFCERKSDSLTVALF